MPGSYNMLFLDRHPKRAAHTASPKQWSNRTNILSLRSRHISCTSRARARGTSPIVLKVSSPPTDVSLRSAFIKFLSTWQAILLLATASRASIVQSGRLTFISSIKSEHTTSG